mmetsp:Transcript_4172/g.12146  ORF Transcript_4172/g.12146 Transcript_4172/m.12146 type:complete len:395 (-) Transcript_4172:65-1249(-)
MPLEEGQHEHRGFVLQREQLGRGRLVELDLLPEKAYPGVKADEVSEVEEPTFLGKGLDRLGSAGVARSARRQQQAADRPQGLLVRRRLAGLLLQTRRLAHGQVEGRAPLAVQGVHVDELLALDGFARRACEEQPHHFDGAARGGEVQRRRVLDPRALVQEQALRDEARTDARPATGGRGVEQRAGLRGAVPPRRGGVLVEVEKAAGATWQPRGDPHGDASQLPERLLLSGALCDLLQKPAVECPTHCAPLQRLGSDVGDVQPPAMGGDSLLIATDVGKVAGQAPLEADQDAVPHGNLHVPLDMRGQRLVRDPALRGQRRGRERVRRQGGGEVGARLRGRPGELLAVEELDAALQPGALVCVAPREEPPQHGPLHLGRLRDEVLQLPVQLLSLRL